MEPNNQPRRQDHVPGTVYLVDDPGSGRHAKSDILMVPAPSEDLDDPLRWSEWRKAYHLGLLVLVIHSANANAYSTVLGAITNWASVVYVTFLQLYNTTPTALNVGFALNLLMLGLANVVLIPISNKLGRRFIYLLSLVICGCSMIWQAKATTIGEFQGINILLGIGAAPFEALVALSIADVFFTHERGAKISYYVFGLSLGSFIGPVCAGYMYESQGWQWIFWWGAIFCAFLFVIFYFTFEETLMRRAPSLEQMPQVIHVTAGPKVPASPEIRRDGTPLLQDLTSGPKVGQRLESTPFRLQYRLWKYFDTPWADVLNDFWWPLKLCYFPAVIWCGVFYGTCVSWLQVLGSTVANIFSAPPYNFSNAGLGLFWIAPMIGSVFGIIYSGPMNDQFVLWKSRRNHGYREPEFLLWCALPTAIIMPAGLMLYGITSAHGLPWIAPHVGGALVGFGLAVGGEVSISYTIDCYKMIDTQAITTVILIRNIIGFAITWAIQPWINAMGQQDAFVLVGVLSFIITCIAGAFIAYGKKWRRWTTARYERLAQERLSMIAR
ncbi:hypothetical protein ANO11243_096260 [Dothideomycetidae sp. 11243]|nr:hypothetical protein ANO11243_096260 [fungal sp. No.11243]